MSEIKDEVRIRTTKSKAYEALTKQSGYTGWWSKNCEISEKVGGESRLTFDKQGSIVKMRFRTDLMDPAGRVKWTCVGHDMDSWIGTTLDWSIAEQAGEVTVSLTHAGWKGDPPEPVVGGWKHFLGSMKQYLETGAGEPW